MGRRKEQSARRQQLIGATERVIATRGIPGLRIKHIAAEAGVSPRLVSYYFPDIPALLVAVHEHAVERFYWARLRKVSSQRTAADKLRTLVDNGLPHGRQDPLWRALYALHLHAAYVAEHAQLMAGLFAQEISLYREVLEEGAESGELRLQDEPATIARTAVALEDAYGLHLVGANPYVAHAQARGDLLGFLSRAAGVNLAAEPSLHG